MTIDRAPHPGFAAFWALRYLVMIVSAVLGWVWPLAIAAFSFFPAEFLAVKIDSGFRDTLSEIWTWVLRTLGKHNDPFRGWNWLAAIFAAFEAGVADFLLSGWHPLLAGGWVDFMCIGLAALLHAHWLRPDIHGLLEG